MMETDMNKIFRLLPLVLTIGMTAMPFAAAAQQAGDVQVKVMGTAVLPDGKITRVAVDTLSLPAGTQTRADDNYVPTLAVEYFVSPDISLETICCVTQHDVTGTGPLAGAGLVSDANIVPATLTAKYHFGAPGGIRPYVGAGPTYFIFIDEGPGATVSALGATRQTLSDSLGVALQAGIDVPVNDSGLSLSIDAKRYWVSTTARWFNAAGTTILQTRHAIDPWVLSAGIAYRF
jgi:outer membrane protein